MGLAQHKPAKLPASVTDDALLELDNQLCFALDVATRRVIRAYRPAFKELGITHPQYLVLLVLWEWAARKQAAPTVKALGERLVLDSGTLTPLLKRMAANGLITRERSTEDERAVHIRLTPAGLALKKRAACVPRTLLKQSPLPLTDLIKLREQLKKLRVALDDV
jgi:DNA-binding MarR family transcriptional regulator